MRTRLRLSLLLPLPVRPTVIFLRATHAELTRAGYTDLDPMHELFYLYSEKEDEEIVADVSILSSTYTHSSPRGSQHHPRDVEAAERYLEVSAAPLKVRQGVALTSKRAGTLPQGTKLKVIDSRVWRRDGTQRVCVAAADAERVSSSSSVASQILPFGWVTLALPPSGSREQYLSPLDC